MSAEDEKGSFVRELSKEIDGTLEQYKSLMMLDWGSRWPTGKKYYEGPEMRIHREEMTV